MITALQVPVVFGADYMAMGVPVVFGPGGHCVILGGSNSSSSSTSSGSVSGGSDITGRLSSSSGYGNGNGIGSSSDSVHRSSVSSSRSLLSNYSDDSFENDDVQNQEEHDAITIEARKAVSGLADHTDPLPSVESWRAATALALTDDGHKAIAKAALVSTDLLARCRIVKILCAEQIHICLRNEWFWATITLLDRVLITISRSDIIQILNLPEFQNALSFLDMDSVGKVYNEDESNEGLTHPTWKRSISGSLNFIRSLGYLCIRRLILLSEGFTILGSDFQKTQQMVEFLEDELLYQVIIAFTTRVLQLHDQSNGYGCEKENLTHIEIVFMKLYQKYATQSRKNQFAKGLKYELDLEIESHSNRGSLPAKRIQSLLLQKKRLRRRASSSSETVTNTDTDTSSTSSRCGSSSSSSSGSSSKRILSAGLLRSENYYGTSSGSENSFGTSSVSDTPLSTNLRPGQVFTQGIGRYVDRKGKIRLTSIKE